VSGAVFLDRDGVLVPEIVIDGQARAPLRLEDFLILPEAAEQVRRLRAAGFPCYVFTNQPEVARGSLPLEILEAMHAQLQQATGVDEIMVCPHDDADGCACRKPKPGMLTDAARRAAIRLEESFVVGDRWRDIDAGRAVGCYSILIERSYSACATADARVQDLTQAVDLILARSPTSSSQHPLTRAAPVESESVEP
jgi:D-glycero-D-manno-heptose 1,7-bisphosphate phosphatase